MCRNFFIILLLTCFYSVTLLPAAQADRPTLNVGFGYDRAPYVILEGEKMSGIEHDIVREVFASLGYDINPSKLSNRQIKMGYHRGLDAAVGAQKFTKRHKQAFYFSDAHVLYHGVAVTHAADEIELKSFESLLPYRVAAWKLAHLALGGEFSKVYSQLKDNMQYYEFEGQTLLVKSFIQGKIDVLLLDRNIFKYYVKKLDFVGQVDLHELFEKRTPTYVRFTDETLRDEFNEGLRKLHESGRYDLIVRSYTE